MIGGEALTPPLARGILPGITRACVLELCRDMGLPAREARLDLAMLGRADEVFLTSSLQGVVPLVALDGRTLPARAFGTRLRAAYAAAFGG